MARGWRQTLRTASDGLASAVYPLLARAREGLAVGRANASGPGWYASLDPMLRPGFEAEAKVLAKLELLQGVESIFSIGPGIGLLERDLVARHGVRLGYVEPHRGSIESLDEALAASANAHLVVERYPRTFQTARIRNRYDLVLAINSWYPFGCSRALLGKALALRNPGAHLAISLASDRDDLRRLLQGTTRITAESLSTWARSIGRAHRFERYAVSQPTRALVQDGRITTSGLAWLAFVAQRPWAELPLGRREEAIRMVLARVARGSLERPRGLLVFGPREQAV
jgi:hypothetical protein